ncbi:hypothetical protein [Shewanella oncorhynchi]|uniref:hypothetical protein n=1 Tax=Shewanella oncorhynchi TaxID=2726434 RepID=UPI002E7AF83B|nr:hypothetical protein [Shewanella oncorhynchi]WVI91553.1 hypothetical protein VR487_11925 [Shewanella oncorhynchi]
MTSNIESSKTQSLSNQPEPDDFSFIAKEAELLVENRISELNAQISIDNFVGAMDGMWYMPTNTGWGISVYNFSGNIINLDHGSWVATGRATAKSSISQPFEMAWSIEYDSQTDTILWSTWGQSQSFKNVSKPDSPVQWQLNHDSGKFVVLVRATVPFGQVNIAKNSYLQATGV